MMYRIFLKTIFYLSLIIFPFKIFSQDCVVVKESLKGSYHGDCKKGKAHGKGKATGKDSYEGSFKTGLPEGQGTYTWQNGNYYKGNFAKGHLDGKGSLTYIRQNATDSVVEGYWKNDVYIGKYEKPYSIYNQTKSVSQLEVEFKKERFPQLTFYITNTSGGASTLRGELPRLKVDEVQVQTGHYGRKMTNYTHAKKTETILYDIRFPIRMKVIIGGEDFEIEFREEGSYVVNVFINQ